MKKSLIPLGLFLALSCTLALGLARPGSDEVPSPLVGKPVPAFQLSHLDNEKKVFTPADLKGKVWVLNVWASWCVSCRKEHPVFLELGQRKDLILVGFNYQDARDSGLQWLKKHGNPYRLTVFDEDGRAGMDLGIIGVPETFVIDRQGKVRHKFTGILTPELVQTRLLPLLKELQGA